MNIKKLSFLFPLAAALLLAGCDTNDGSSASSSVPSSDSSSSIPSSDSSSETPSSDSSSSSAPSSDSSSEEDKKTDLTIDDLAVQAKAYADASSKVYEGSINKKSVSEYYDTEDTYTYVYGTDDNGDTMKYADAYGNVVYVMNDSDHNVVAVEKDYDDNFVKANDTYEKVAPYFSYYIEWEKSYGAEGLFSNLVDLAKKNVNKDFSAYKENGNVYFHFGYFEHYENEEPLTFYSVDVVSPYLTEGALENLTVTILQYSGSGKYAYDSATDTCVINEGAKASQTDTYAIAQKVGDRTYKNEVDLKAFEFTSISFKDSSDNAISETSPLEMETGSFKEIMVVSAPDTANSDFDTPSVSVSGPEDGLYAAFQKSWDGSNIISVDAYAAGDYVVTVKTKNCEAKFAVKVTESVVSPDYMAVRRYVESGLSDIEYDSEKMLDGDSYTTNVEVSSYFVPFFKPFDADKNINVEVTDLEGNELDDEDDYYLDHDSSIYSWDEENEKSAIELSFYNAGEYKVVLTSAVNENFSETYYVTVESDDFRNTLNAADGFVLLSGGTSGTNAYQFVFSPDDDDEMAGTLTITDLKWKDTAKDLTYTISKVEDESYYEINYEDNNCFWGGIYFGADYNLYAVYENETSKLLESGSLNATMPKRWAGYSHSDDEDATRYSVDYLNFYTDGTVEGSISEEDSEDPYLLHCEYTIRQNADVSNLYTIVFSFDGYVENTNNAWFGDMPSTATFDAEKGTLTFSASYLEADFVLYQ